MRLGDINPHTRELAPLRSSGEKVSLQLVPGLGQKLVVIGIALNRDRTTIPGGGPNTRTPSFNITNQTIRIKTKQSRTDRGPLEDTDLRLQELPRGAPYT
jgi:hypothetical protein